MIYKDLVYWNLRGYGKATIIKRRTLIAVFIIICIVTPFTNWAIPLATTIFKQDIKIRQG